MAPFGLCLTGVQLADLTASGRRRLYAALTTQGVLAVRGQRLSDAAFVRFLQRLGPMTFTEGEPPLAGQPQLNLVSNVGRTRAPRSVFHSDTSYVQAPPSVTALRMVRAPQRGGATQFCNQYLAWEALSERQRRALRSARVLHIPTGVELDQAQRRGVWHPLARRHPHTGRVALYLSTPERCVDLRGVATADPGALISELYEHSIASARRYVHRWRSGDVVLWDNRCTLHRADHSAVVGDRVLHRGMCAGEAPLAAFAERA